VNGDAAVVVDRRRDAEPGRDHVGPGVLGLLELPGEILDDLVFAQSDRWLPALVVDMPIVVHDSDQHLGAAKVDADRLACAQQRRWLSGGGMRKY
jgi:hypothetical protein